MSTSYPYSLQALNMSAMNTLGDISAQSPKAKPRVPSDPYERLLLNISAARGQWLSVLDIVNAGGWRSHLNVKLLLRELEARGEVVQRTVVIDEADVVQWKRKQP